MKISLKNLLPSLTTLYKKFFSAKIKQESINYVPEGHKVTRFVFSKGHYSKEKNTLKYGTFMPPKKNPDEISVYDIENLGERTIWEIGSKHVAVARNKNIKGRGDLLESAVNTIFNSTKNKKLYVERDTVVHERHANIRNIETSDGESKVIAKKLALATKDNLYFPFVFL